MKLKSKEDIVNITIKSIKDKGNIQPSKIDEIMSMIEDAANIGEWKIFIDFKLVSNVDKLKLEGMGFQFILRTFGNGYIITWI